VSEGAFTLPGNWGCSEVVCHSGRPLMVIEPVPEPTRQPLPQAVFAAAGGPVHDAVGSGANGRRREGSRSLIWGCWAVWGMVQFPCRTLEFAEQLPAQGVVGQHAL